MIEPRTFTLAESLVARDTLSREVANLAGVAWDDVRDAYGEDHIPVENPFWYGGNQTSVFAGKFARMLVDRLLWSRDYGVILDYDPDAIIKKDPFAPENFSKPAESEKLPIHRYNPSPEQFVRDYIQVYSIDEQRDWEAKCYYEECLWETTGYESVVEEAAYEHAQTHIDEIAPNKGVE